ncbi:MAG: hypothetical protein M3281_06580, partial [Chloroflexota bacterium]|nr:hypothetical protein [Chloroflexota bacterium]
GEWLGLSQPAAVKLVDRLAADGLAERGRGRDRRSVAVGLSPAGLETASAILEARERVVATALEALSAEEQAELTHLLEKMLEHLTLDVPHARRICRLCDVAACPQLECPVTIGARGRGNVPPELQGRTGV